MGSILIHHCYIHIGTEKSGSTSIQAMLRANAGSWEKNGIYISRNFGAVNDRDFATYAMRDDRIDDARRKAGLLDKQAIERFRTEFRKRVDSELRNCGSPTLILSSEHFHSRLYSEEEVAFLKEMLDNYCQNYTIICYIRPQHELAVSLYSTALRVGHKGFPLIPDPKKNLPYYEYDALLSRWAHVFGRQNVIPMIYGERDSCTSFREACGLPEPTVMPARVNDRLNGEAQAVLELLNGHLKDKQRGNLSSLIAKIGNTPPNLPPRDQAETFFAYFAPSNERVRAAYFPERPALFNVSFQEYPEAGRITVLSEERLVELFSELWALKAQEAAALREKLTRKGSK